MRPAFGRYVQPAIGDLARGDHGLIAPGIALAIPLIAAFDRDQLPGKARLRRCLAVLIQRRTWKPAVPPSLTSPVNSGLMPMAAR